MAYLDETLSRVEVRAPLANRLGRIMLRTSMGVAQATSDLTQSIDSFCAGAGSQFCDYRAGVPVRPVLCYLRGPAPGVNPSFAKVALPSSPRLGGDELVTGTQIRTARGQIHPGHGREYIDCFPA